MLQNSTRTLINFKIPNSLRSVQCCYLSLMQKKTDNLDSTDKELSPFLKKVKAEIESDKKKLQWRKPIGEDPEEWSSKFKIFADMNQTSDFIVAMQKEIDLRPKSIMAWWKKRQENTERHMQQFIQQRLDILGPDLAAAHFILFRGGAVRFTHDKKWMKADEKKEFYLPNVFDANYKLEAIRCDNMTLYYEGLENLRNLHCLKFLSFRNVKTFDDWCLDRVSGSTFPVLEVLDISGTKSTSLGFSCLYRLPTLKLLIVDDPKQSLEYELTCAMLEEAIVHLKIVGAKEIHSDEDLEKTT